MSSGSDSYWFTRGGLEHRHENHRLDRERNKELQRIGDALTQLVALLTKLEASSSDQQAGPPDQPANPPESGG